MLLFGNACMFTMKMIQRMNEYNTWSGYYLGKYYRKYQTMYSFGFDVFS